MLCPNLPIILKHKQKEKEKWDDDDDDIPFQPEPDLLSLPLIFYYWPLNWMWSHVPRIKLIGAGVGVAWYVVAIRHIAQASSGLSGSDIIILNRDMGGLGAVFWMWFWWIPTRGRGMRFGLFDGYHVFSFSLIIIATLVGAYYSLLK